MSNSANGSASAGESKEPKFITLEEAAAYFSNLTEFLLDVKVNFIAINNYIEYPKRFIKLKRSWLE